MATEVDIANLALARVGSADILSLTDADDENARVVNRFYLQTVKECLRSHQWSCATARDSLAKLTERPTFGYDFYYQLPNDFVRAIYLNDVDVWDPVDGWALEKDRLLTDEDSANLVYVQLDEDATTYDDLLVNAIVVKLASKIVGTLTGDVGRASNFAQEYTIVMSEAKTADAQESSSNENHPLQGMLARSPLSRRRRFSQLG